MAPGSNATAGEAGNGQVLFSVVIPCFGRAVLLERALASLERQSRQDFECIVVDDGSTPPLVPLEMRSLAALRWHRQENLGPAAARNAGAALAGGRFLVFLDSDDWLAPWALATCAAVLDRHPGAVLMTAARVSFSNDTELPADHPAGQDGDDAPGLVGVVAEGFSDYLASHRVWRGLGAGTTIVDRSAFERAAGFDETLIHGEDLDFALRLGTAEFVQIRTPPTVWIRQHPGNLSHDHAGAARAVLELVRREKCGYYPGGVARRSARRRMLARDVRPVVLACLEAGETGLAWRLYCASFGWQLRDGRLRFVLGALPVGLWRRLCGKGARS